MQQKKRERQSRLISCLNESLKYRFRRVTFSFSILHYQSAHLRALTVKQVQHMKERAAACSATALFTNFRWQSRPRSCRVPCRNHLHTYMIHSVGRSGRSFRSSFSFQPGIWATLFATALYFFQSAAANIAIFCAAKEPSV